jgi:hypothetical protein
MMDVNVFAACLAVDPKGMPMVSPISLQVVIWISRSSATLRYPSHS